MAAPSMLTFKIQDWRRRRHAESLKQATLHPICNLDTLKANIGHRQLTKLSRS